MMLTPSELQAADRARELLAATSLFDELGLGQLARSARAVAGDVADLAVALDAERSSRVAIQARAERLQEIIGKGAYYAAIAQNVHGAQATVIAKHELAARKAEIQSAR